MLLLPPAGQLSEITSHLSLFRELSVLVICDIFSLCSLIVNPYSVTSRGGTRRARARLVGGSTIPQVMLNRHQILLLAYQITLSKFSSTSGAPSPRGLLV